METAPPPRTPARFLLPLGIAVAALLPFLPALSAGFVNWDDTHNFIDNPHYRGLGWSHLRWMFTYAVEHYIPLTWLTFGADYLLWGMDPRGYHATNLALHALNAALVFVLAESLLRRARPESPPGSVRPAAAAAALLFALHPLRAESVAWITERRDVLSGVFFLLTILAYLRAADAPPSTPERRGWMGASALLFALMMLSKAMGMTLPLVLVVLDVYPLGRRDREPLRALLVEKIPHGLVMIGAVILTWFTQTGVGSIDREKYSLLQSVAQPGFRLSFYGWKTLMPAGLAPIYHFHPAIGPAQIGGWIAVLALTGWSVAVRHGRPAALAAWVSYLVLIAPVSGVLQTGIYYAADRYSYLACLPFALLAAGAWMPFRDRRPGIATGLAGVVLAALAALAWRQTGFWKDSETLWTRQIAVDPGSWTGYLNRGSARHDAGDRAGALADYTRCLELKTDNVVARTNRGTVRLDLDDPRGALEDYGLAIGLHPTYERAWNLRGLALERLGDRDGARRDFDRAIELKPDYPIALTNRGFLRRNAGDLSGALQDAEAALRNDPDNGVAFILRASVERARGNLVAALADLERAVRLAPASVEAVNNRAMILMQTGRYRDALTDYDRAVALNPVNPSVLLGRAQAKYLLGDRPGAAADLDLALQKAPAGWPLRADAETLLQKARPPR
ncbi:MAG TPA: tetratricopeptide repeat protein [Planctomycetota bacterium]|nr:tetratricopeptide repeat protein [Planctomycetota bacterium]